MERPLFTANNKPMKWSTAGRHTRDTLQPMGSSKEEAAQVSLSAAI